MTSKAVTQKTQVDLIITHGVVITIDKDRRIIDDGAVVIKGDRIINIADTAEVLQEYHAPEIIDAHYKAVMPGLIDIHAHAGHALIRTMCGADGNAWEKVCETAYTVASDENFWFAEAQLAATERLRFGVTTGLSLLGGGDTIMRSDDPIYADAHCRGVVEVGTDTVVAVGPTRPPHPRTYAKWQGDQQTSYPVTFEEQLNSCKQTVRNWHGTHDGQIRIALLTPVLRPEHKRDLSSKDYQSACEQTKTVHNLSIENDLLFTQDGHTNGSIHVANEIGILGPRSLFSHSTDLSIEEQKLVASSNTRIAHNPSANASIYGRCPVPEMLDMGVIVGLGSDATAPDRSGDMFRHMQQAMHYHRRHFRDSDILPPGRVLEMATIDAAKALGVDQEVGSLEVGKKANIILVDLSRPHMAPFQMPAYRVVCFANGNDVETVIIAGKVKMKNRIVLSIDEKIIIDNAQEASIKLIERANLQHTLKMPDNFWKSTRY